MQIYVAKSGHQTGPFSEEQIQSMLQSGMIGLDDSAWHEGLPSWLPLHQVLKVCPPVAQTSQPPPLPETPPQELPDEEVQPGPIIRAALMISTLRKQLRPGLILRDVVIISLLSWIGGFVIGLAAGRSALNLSETRILLAWVVSAVFLGTLGFTISGCLAPPGRWRHLGLVAVGTWLVGLINVVYFDSTFADWCKSAVFVALNMGLGGALSYLFKRSSQPSSQESR